MPRISRSSGIPSGGIGSEMAFLDGVGSYCVAPNDRNTCLRGYIKAMEMPSVDTGWNKDDKKELIKYAKKCMEI